MAETERYEIQGRTVALPAVVRDASSGSVMYLVDRDGAQKLVPDAFEPVEAAPGKTQLTLVIVDYRDNDLGDYDEVGIVFFVKPAGRPEADLGSYIYKLPVNQSFTCEAGCRIWGFPKTVDPLDVRLTRRRAGVRWSREDGEVFEMVVPRGGRLALPGQTACTYTLHDGVVWRTRLQLRGRGLRVGPGGARVRLGHHPIAERLRAWGVPGRALASAWVEHASMDFAAAEPLR